MLDPFQAMAGNFPFCALHRAHLLGIARQSCGNAIDRRWDLLFGKQSVHAPESGPCAVLIKAFHIPMALPLPLRSANDL